MKKQFEQNRKAVGIETGNISGLLHSYTQEAAKRPTGLKGRLFGSTGHDGRGRHIRAYLRHFPDAESCAAHTEPPDRRERDTGREPEHTGQVSSADEIALLAQSFNYMVSGLKEKETIKETFGKYLDPKIVRTLLEGQALTHAVKSGQ